MKIKSITSEELDYTIYIDTDSLFATAIPLIKVKHPEVNENDDEIMSKYILETASDVQNYINSAYDVYVKKFHNLDKHELFIKQEMVGKAAFWNAKKRYAIWVINQEGVTVDFLEIKGLDVVRSDFPKAFQGFMTSVLWDILKFKPQGEVDDFILNFKENLDKQELSKIMFSSGINDIKKHDTNSRGKFEINKGTPAHVKAALMYNDILNMKNFNEVEPIQSGDKIKWTYLKNNPWQLESCAIKGYKDPEFIMDLVAKNIDYAKVFESKLSKKLEDFYTALKWESIPDNSNVVKFFDF